MWERRLTEYIITILFYYLLWLDQSSMINIHVTPLQKVDNSVISMYIVMSHNDSTRNCLSQEFLFQCQMIQNRPTIEGILLFHAQPHHHSKVPYWIDNILPFPLRLTIIYRLMISMATTHAKEHSPIFEVTNTNLEGEELHFCIEILKLSIDNMILF